MAYNPKIHHRKSIRLKGYDYSQAGLYFVTLCCQDKVYRFSDIVDGKMILNDAGKNANECWFEIPKHFPNVKLNEHIIMPNHVHGIIELTNENNVVVGVNEHNVGSNENSTKNDGNVDVGSNDNLPLHSPHRQTPFKSPSKTMGSIVRGFKIGVTKWFRTNTNVKIVWQSNYYEHIIRNEKAYQKISEYIINNPKKWMYDKFCLK